MVPMQQAILRFGSKVGAGPDQKQHTLVLLSGDGNRNDDHHSFADTIQEALRVGMFVEVWAWKNSVSRVYTQVFAEHYGGSFAVRYFDDYRDKIVRQSAAGSGVGAAAVDDDDDWMVCLDHARSSLMLQPPSLRPSDTMKGKASRYGCKAVGPAL